MQIYVIKYENKYLCYSSLGYGLTENYGAAEIFSTRKRAEWYVDYLSEEAESGSEFWKFKERAEIKTWHIQEE